MIEVINAHPGASFGKKAIEQLTRSVLRGEKKRARELTIVFVGDREMRRLHREFLSRDYATDVMSFPLDDHEEIEAEVYVNVDQARRQAPEYGASLTREVYRLVVHGILHLVGFNDKTGSQRDHMRRREDKYIQWKNR